MQHSTDFGCSANLASSLRPAVSPRPADGSRCAPKMPYPHDPAGMPPPVYWCLPAADRLRRNAAGYSNQPRVTLLVDGKEFAAQDGDKIFKFTVPISGTHEIKAVAGSCTDCMTITKADKPDQTYRAEGQVENWFDKPEELMKEGYYSIMDSMETLQKSPAANKLLSSLMVKASNAYGDVAKNVKMPPEMERQMARTSLRSILKQVAKSITPADVQQLNAALNKIKKES